jgi:uncharacterized protein YkwD
VAYIKARRLLGTGVLTACLLVPAASATASTPSAIVHRVNQVRAQHGLPQLRMSSALGRAAGAHSAAMIAGGGLSHGSLQSRLRRYLSAATYGEAIAWMPGGAGSAASVVNAWMHSPPHRAILLSAQFHRVGVGERQGRMGGQRGTTFTLDVAS